MGVGGSVPNVPKEEIQELIKKILGTFTLQYTKEYALALVYKLKEEAKAEEKAKNDEPWKLQERPPWSEDFKSGWLVKQGGVRKSWKKRFFVVRPNYSIDYYETEEEAKKEKGKKKGSIGLCGYRVIEDPNDGLLKRLRTMAEKLGMNPEDIPKPSDKYPPLTIELQHSRRRCYYLQCANEDEFKGWVDQLKTCCWRAYGLKNQEFCHKRAFNEAVRKTRYALGRWGWWSYGGTEEQILSDLIVDEIEWSIMGRIYSQITGPWIIRTKVQSTIQKQLDTAIGVAVTPAWAAMEKAVEELRPKIEPKIKELVAPIGKAEAEIIEKLKNGAMDKINPVLQEHVTPRLSKIVEIIKAPMSQAYDITYKIFDEEISKFEPKGSPTEIKKHFHDLDWLPRSYKLWPAQAKIDLMYDPLWALHEIFPDIYPWRAIWDGYDEIRGTMDNAVYTWEQEFISALEQDEKQDPKALAEKIKAKVMEDYRYDGNRSVIEYYHAILKSIVYPPFEKIVIPACQMIIDPVAELIPEPLKEFIDPNAMFEELINGIVDDSITTVLKNEAN